jgi:glycosyltransferase involved in cell wall biosynthesis
VSHARILFISHEASRTGAPILLLHLMRWIKQHTSWNVDVLLNDGGELSGEFFKLGHTYALPTWSPALTPNAVRDRLVRRRMVSRLRSTDYSLVYSNTATNGDVLKLLGSRQPIISHIHELATTIRLYGEDNFDAVRRHTTRYIACAESVKSDLTSQWPIEPDAVDVVHEFVHLPPRQDDASKAGMRSRIRRELGIPDDAFVVGASGQVVWRKAPDLFIGLARAVKMRQPSANVHFVWVGAFREGVESIAPRALEHDVRGLGLEGHVHFIGSRSNPLDYFHAFDVFAMVSREDPFPLVCLEVASLGAPILCFDYAGGTKEFVEDDCGFVLPYQDVDAMAEAVLTLRQRDDLRYAQGRRAAAKVRHRHDINSAAPRIVDIIESTLRAAPP